MTAASYATSAELARELGPFPGYAPNRESMLRVMRNHRRAAYNVARGEYEGLSIAPRGIDAACARRTCCRPRAPSGTARCARRAARLPQRAGHRHRAHRHDRPADGLRHHRHRARLRPGEVQEARRRRLLQDHQPVGAAGPVASSATATRRDRRHRPLLQGRGHAGRQPAGLATRTSSARASRRGVPKIESELGGAFEIGFVFNRYVLGDEFCRDALGFTDASSQNPMFNMLEALGFTARTSSAPTTTSAAR
jgi:ribonucleoside-diphosphate reductase alpha chain